MTPAAISTMPTRCMNVDGEKGIIRVKNGLRYWVQVARRLVNLSRPATMGTMPKASRKAHHGVSSRLSMDCHSFRAPSGAPKHLDAPSDRGVAGLARFAQG